MCCDNLHFFSPLNNLHTQIHFKIHIYIIIAFMVMCHGVLHNNRTAHYFYLVCFVSLAPAINAKNRIIPLEKW